MLITQTEVQAQTQPVVSPGIDIRTEVVTIQLRTGQNTGLIGIVTREIVRGLRRAARNRQIDLIHRRISLKNLVPPLVVIHRIIVLIHELSQTEITDKILTAGRNLIRSRQGIARQTNGNSRTDIIQHLVRTHHIQFRRYGTRHGVLSRKRHIDTLLVATTGFGLHIDNTVGSTRTVDRSRRSVLEDVHRSDIVLVDRLQRRSLNRRTVQQNQRRRIGTHRTQTMNTDRRSRSQLTVTGHNLKTGYLTLQSVHDVGAGTVFDLLGLHLIYRTNHRTDLLTRTITDHHDILDARSLFPESHVDMRLTGYAHLLGFVTDKRDRERRIGGNRQCKLPVSSGRRTGRRTLCHNRSTDDRFSLLIGNRTRHLLVLRKSQRTETQYSN